MSDALDIFFPPDETEAEETREATSREVANDNQGAQQQEGFKDDIYKKWFRSKEYSGFIAVRGFLEAGKVGVDIGQVRDSGATNTLVWADAIEFATYLRAVANGQGKTLYPANPRRNAPAETYMYYGGTNTKSGPISRILKVNYWGHQNDGSGTVDENGFAFKAGHFKANLNDQGAFIPQMDQPLSTDLIKVSRAEVAEMSYRVDLALNHFVYSMRGEDVFRALNGNNR